MNIIGSYSDFLNIAKEHIIGRDEELFLLYKAVNQELPIILEGPIATGKTELAKTLAKLLDKPFYRVDGDDSLTAIKLKGWFDPPLVLKKGFSLDTFIPGPLTQAMREGGIFFFNETNRAPSETINAILSALDEKMITVPQLGEIEAEKGFLPIFAFNPQDTVATNPLSSAFYDRCIWIKLLPQSLEEMIQITTMRTKCNDTFLIKLSCEIVQATLVHPELKKASTVRGAIQLVHLLCPQPTITRDTLLYAVLPIHSRKITIKSTSAKNEETILTEIIDKLLIKYQDHSRIESKKA